MNRKFWLLVIIFGLQIMPYYLVASEVDQFTDREKYQDSALDFTERINKYTNRLIEKGVDNFNKEYQQKKLTMDEIHRYAAFEIYKSTAWFDSDKHNYPDIPSRVNLLYALLFKSGQGPIQKWIKKEENNTYWIRIKDNIYSNTYPDFANKNVIIKVGGEFIGSDKVDHFFDQGYSYWIKSDFGLSDLKAKEYGVDSENGWYGLAAGGVFSFADLRVNWGGYQFYKNLFLGENSLLLISKDGVVSMRHSFDWSEHIDWQFDELRNPSNYSSLMKSRIYSHIEKNIDRYRTTYKFLQDRNLLSSAEERETFYLTENCESKHRDFDDLKDLLTPQTQTDMDIVLVLPGGG